MRWPARVSTLSSSKNTSLPATRSTAAGGFSAATSPADSSRSFPRSVSHQSVTGLVVRNADTGATEEDVADSGWGGFLVRRELFDRELARLAVQAGARLRLGAKAASVVREEGGG